MPIEHASLKKPVMLDIADLFTYSIAREFSGTSAIDYGRYCGEVLVDVLPNYGDEIVLGG